MIKTLVCILITCVEAECHKRTDRFCPIDAWMKRHLLIINIKILNICYVKKKQLKTK